MDSRERAIEAGVDKLLGIEWKANVPLRMGVTLVLDAMLTTDPASVTLVNPDDLCRCESCGHLQAEPNWCHACGHRVMFAPWAVALTGQLAVAVEALRLERALADQLAADVVFFTRLHAGGDIEGYRACTCEACSHLVVYGAAREKEVD